MLEWTVEVDGFEIPLELGIDYQPEEKMTLEYPGCPESIEISSISLFGFDVPPEHEISKLVDADYDNIFEKYRSEVHDIPW